MMFTDIIGSIVTALSESGVSPVYSAYDAVDTAKKGNGIFTVVAVCSFEASTPIYSQYTVFFPFRAELEIKLAAPQGYSLSQLYSYYDENISPVISELSGMTCRISGMNAKFDTNIQRLVFGVKLSASGITSIERSAT